MSVDIVNRVKRNRILKVVYEEIREDSPLYMDKELKITCSLDIERMFKHLIREAKEYFYALHLDSKNKILCQDLVSIGSLNASVVHPREVFKSALLSSASAILFVHNHPSGDSTPSREDLALTKRLKEGGELLGIRVLDHIIIGNDNYSFANSGSL